MSGKRTLTQQAISLRLDYFCPPSTTSPEHPKTKVVSTKLAEGLSTHQRNVRRFAECDCA